MSLVVELTHPCRHAVYDKPLNGNCFAPGIADGAATLLPKFSFWPGQRFMAGMDPHHDYVCAIFRADGTPGRLRGAFSSRGRRYLHFTHLNDPFVILADRLPHAGDPATVFHWAAAWYSRLANTP